MPSYPNGQWPKSATRKIAGGGRLRPDAAAAFNALAQKVYAREGWRLSASEAYRDIDRQWYFWNLYQAGKGNLAAYPGTSNHGNAVALDLTSWTDRSWIDRYGAEFGFSKSWSDAQSEWWHILYDPARDQGHGRKDPGPDYDPLPKWWKKVGHKIALLRKTRLAKQEKRRRKDTPPVRRGALHKMIQRLNGRIAKLIARRKKAQRG